ncbi:MAG: leucyl aminopeptidase [Pseudomonadota bacterium]
MKYSLKSGAPQEQKTPVLVTDLTTAGKVAGSERQTPYFKAAATDFDNAVGQTLLLTFPKGAAVQRVLVVGGLDAEVTLAAYRKACNAAATALARLPVRSGVWGLGLARVIDTDGYSKTTAGLFAVSRAAYRFDHYKTQAKAPAEVLRTLGVLADGRSESLVRKALRDANALKAGLDFARDLGNEPPNVANPTYLLQQARAMARGQTNVKVSALDEKRMTELGMGAFMAVSKGSETPGRMIIIEYRGAPRSKPPVALVGKGITFDTGGISLKPPPAMDEMKFDMCGAAAVLGATRAVINAKLPINLVTVVAAAENMPSGRATRPADIVTTHAGLSVEILNTDAEGRLVLCDALSYVKRYKPTAVVDVATLTGAAIVALGSHASALYANDDAFAEELLEAGERAGDRAWHMPLWDEYQASLKSNFADMANVGGREAGSVTAACFLSRFTEDLTWAHLDVAGSAFQGGPAKGATGRPVHLLFEFLRNRA